MKTESKINELCDMYQGLTKTDKGFFLYALSWNVDLLDRAGLYSAINSLDDYDFGIFYDDMCFNFMGDI